MMEHDHRADMDEEPQQHRRRRQHHHHHHHLQILAGVMKRKRCVSFVQYPMSYEPSISISSLYCFHSQSESEI
jgi:hypothetical protein